MPHRIAPRRAVYGPLSAVEFPGDGPTVVCLHGYGADAADLAPLAQELAVAGRWLFPEAPISLAGGPLPSSRAWFPISEEAFLRMNMGTPLDLSSERPAGLDAAAEQLGEFLAAAGVPWESAYLGGFSQGSMTALEWTLRQSAAPAGLFLLSGTLVDAARTRERAARLPRTRLYQTHGRQDPVLPFARARDLYAALTAGAFAGTWVEFDGGHELPGPALTGLTKFLTASSS